MLDPRTLFGDVETGKPVIVAVSGGGDSVALLHLASSWAKATGVALKAVTVDHGLRPEAAAEAAFVAGICENLEIQHFTLAWDGSKPTTGISEAAREARYLLMSEFARDIGVDTILTGHTLDDQAETLWMRNSRYSENSQVRGLSGMARGMMLCPGIRVIRPLLALQRSELRAFLTQIGQAWIEDPTNFDMSFERVRARMALGQSSIKPMQIARFAELCGRIRLYSCKQVFRILQEELHIGDGLVFRIAAEHLRPVHQDLALLAIQVICALAGGRDHFISHEQAHRVLDLDVGGRLTAGSCVIENQKGQLTVYREYRNMPLVLVEPGQQKVWDGRLLITNNSSKEVICRAAELTDLVELEKSGTTPPNVSPKAALRAMPVISHGGRGPFFPLSRIGKAIAGVAWTLEVPAIEHYCSDYDRPLLELVEHVRGEVEPVLPSSL